MFEYMDAEKKGLDAFTVMARAIRRHYDNDDEKIPPALARIMAKIIDDGFLDGVLEEQSKLISHSKRILERTEKLVRDEERKMYSVMRRTEELVNACNGLEMRIELMKKIDEEEPDILLRGARKAYTFIESETHDKEKACKAYNSYLQGMGKWKMYSSGKGETDGQDNME